MSDKVDLDSIAIIYDGDYVSSVPNTYKGFLECLRNAAALTNEEFQKKTVWRGDFPITCKKDYIRAIKSCKDEGIMQIDLVSNELDEKEGIGEKDYLQFLELKDPEEKIEININEEENKEEIIYIQSDVNEFYAVTQVTQYYKNNNNKPVELSILYPLRKEINFRKFSININGKKSFSRIFEKEKANEKYSDAVASGNIGVISKYAEEEPNSYSITISNVEPNALIELTSEFIQFITSNDMSLCFSVMTCFPTFSDLISRNYLKNVNGKISLKTHSKITRLVNQNFTIDKHFKREFNKDFTSCDIEYQISNDSKNYNSVLSLLFRTEKMNEPYLLSQYNPEKDETSYIFGMIYDQKPIPVPEKPDTDIDCNYYQKYQSTEKTDTPSLFIFLIDQSGSMAGSSMKLVSESLLFFLQSLPKDSYFQLIGFGSTFKKINDKPVIYNKENVKYTMDIIRNLKADLGGTDISSPLKDIFNCKDYDDINLGRNLFILTDGEVNNREECLELISTNSEKFKIHAIGIGSSFDKKLIQNAGIQGKGSYHFVNKVSEVNSVIIQSLSKCLRNYLLNSKLSLDKIKPEQEFLPKNNFIYPDEILNYYFIIKGKDDKENIQINFESQKKHENYTFSKEKIIKESDGEIVGQIIVGNIIKNADSNFDENVEIKLSKNYQVLSKKTSLFAVGEGQEANKIAEFKQVKKREKPKYNIDLNSMHSRFSPVRCAMKMQVYDDEEDNDDDDAEDYLCGNAGLESGPVRRRAPALKCCSMAAPKKCKKENNCKRAANFLQCCSMAAPKKYDDDENDSENEGDYNMACEYKKEENDMEENNLFSECYIPNFSLEKKGEKSSSKEEMKKNEKVEFSNKELILTQDIFEGCWNVNPQTNFLIEKQKTIYEKIEKLMKDKNLDKEEIKVTLLVLYYLNTDTSINKSEYELIMKKGINFLEKNGLNFEEILTSIKN